MANIAFHDPRLAHVAGGGEQVTLVLARWLVQAGHTVTLVTRTGRTSPLLLEALAECASLQVAELAAPVCLEEPLPEAAISFGQQQALANSDPLSMDALAFNASASRFYRRTRFDFIVISFIPDLCGLPDCAATVLHLSGLPPSREVADLEAALLLKVKFFVSVSCYITTELRRLFPVLPESQDIHLMYPGIAKEFFLPPFSRCKQYDLCYAGRLGRRKGVQFLLEAIAALADPLLTAVIIGDGAERVFLRERIAEMGLEDRITMVGRKNRSEVIGLLDSSRIFVYPPVLPEAFGCAPLEAMARGVPVITTNLGGMSEYIRATDNALVCEPADSGSLAKCAARLLSDLELCSSIKAAGRRTALRFEESKVASRALQLYESFLDPLSISE